MTNLLERVIPSKEPLLVAHADMEVEAASLARRKKGITGQARLAYLANALKGADLTALLIAGFAGYILRFGFTLPNNQSAHLFIYLSSIVTFVALHMAGAYRTRSIDSIGTQLSNLFVGGVGATFVILLCGFFSGSLRDYSRIWIISSFAIAFSLLLLNRIVATRMVMRARNAHQLMESIVIVGANEHAEKMIEKILDNAHSSVNILGIFDDRVQRAAPATLKPRIIGSTDKLLSYLRNNRVDRVVVALPWIATDRINMLLKKLRTVPVRIDLVPNDVVWQFPNISMERLGTVPVLTIANGRINKQIGLIKRLEDIVVSTLLLAVTSPLLLLIALAIKLDSKGPAIFKQRRHGYNNQIFEVYKFRSMTVSDPLVTELAQATRNDPRITRVGKFLRRSSLDELPQLLNVLKGHMSIVGPRPHAVQHNIEYSAVICEYFARHNVRPGITGWAQVNGLRGETNTSEKMHRRVDADLYYIEHWSLLLDFKIILMTAITVWFQDTAY